MIFLILVLCATSIFAQENIISTRKLQFDEFKVSHGKKYVDLIEEAKRLKLFTAALDQIDLHNLNPLKEFVMGLNKYSDISSAEFNIMKGYRKKPQNYVSGIPTEVLSEGARRRRQAAATTVDWRTKGYVTDVKDQDICGSCWAFSAVGSLEGQQYKKAGKLVTISEQDLVDCSDQACDGGWMTDAFVHIHKNGGIDEDSFYPYKAKRSNCKHDPNHIGSTVSKIYEIPENDEATLRYAVEKYGPVAAAINVKNSFQHYKSGIYYEPACNPKILNHAVLIVGYGTENGKDYWLAKNSFGKSWGMNGYIKMARNRNNNCGIAAEASFAIP